MQEGRRFIGIDAKAEYLEMGRQRLAIEGKPSWRKLRLAQPADGQEALSFHEEDL